jgi:hypothetical protein
MNTELYTKQLERWPKTGRHILAQFDAETIVVYQAYKPAIAKFAVEHQYFGGEFSGNRMSWIKPNFLWMMFRSGWAQKSDQECVLSVRIRRDGFEQILIQAAHTRFDPQCYETPEVWKQTLVSEVRLQWDPDHNAQGHPVERRAIQLGSRPQCTRTSSRAPRDTAGVERRRSKTLCARMDCQHRRHHGVLP